jgi:hypothetical protein
MSSSKQEQVDLSEEVSVEEDSQDSRGSTINSDKAEVVLVGLEVATLSEIYLKNLKSSLEVEGGHKVAREGLVEDSSKLRVKILWYALFQI